MATRRQLYGRKVELHHRDWSQVKQISVKILEFLGGAKGGFLILFTLQLCPLAHAQNESEFSLDMRTFSSLLPLVHQYPVMPERGCTSPGKALGSQFTWDLYQARYPQMMALKSLSCHIPCVQPGAIPGTLHGSSRATICHHLHCSSSNMAAVFSTQSLSRKYHRVRHHFVIPGCKFTLSKDAHILLKA